MNEGSVKDDLATKFTSKKAEFIASYLASLHSLSYQTTLRINDTKAWLFSSSESTTVGLQIALHLSKSNLDIVQKPFAIIWDLLHISIISHLGTESIKIKSMNKGTKRENWYFGSFYTIENEIEVLVQSKYVTIHITSKDAVYC